LFNNYLEDKVMSSIMLRPAMYSFASIVIAAILLVSSLAIGSVEVE